MERTKKDLLSGRRNTGQDRLGWRQTHLCSTCKELGCSIMTVSGVIPVLVYQVTVIFVKSTTEEQTRDQGLTDLWPLSAPARCWVWWWGWRFVWYLRCLPGSCCDTWGSGAHLVSAVEQGCPPGAVCTALKGDRKETYISVSNMSWCPLGYLEAISKLYDNLTSRLCWLQTNSLVFVHFPWQWSLMHHGFLG